jgi:hypothetical protein
MDILITSLSIASLPPKLIVFISRTHRQISADPI